jgi:O-acetyl-ADP-ribose deacetylase (regulator of RNase III)
MIEINSKVLRLERGDITELDTDAIVNAANEQLILGAGVAGAIRTKGGPTIQEECDKIGGTFVGGAVITTGGKLKARHVIHAVGPRIGEGDEDYKLKNAVQNTLKVASENDLSSVAFPAISTGIYGYPKDKCAAIMIRTILEFLQQDSSLKEVVICLYDQGSYDVFNQEMSKHQI